MFREFIQYISLTGWLLIVALCAWRGNRNRNILFLQGVTFGFLLCLLVLKIIIYFRSWNVVNIYNCLIPVF